MPLFQKNEDGKLIYVGGRFVPIMETLTEGVTSFKMISRTDYAESPFATGKTPTFPYVSVWEQNPEDLQTEVKEGTSHEEELLGFQSDVGSRTSFIVKLKGDIDVMISPLLLEALQRLEVLLKSRCALILILGLLML